MPTDLPGPLQTDQLLRLIQDVAAEVINPRFHALSSSEVDQKEPGDYVTIADREAEELLTAELRRRAPGCLVVGEEATYADPGLTDGLATAAHAFTIDPVDGTGNFVRGSTRHAVMVAELRAGEVTRSWIWQPQLDQAWVAERGAGVRCNGRPVTRRAAERLPVGASSRRRWRGFDAGGRLAPVTSTNLCAGVDYPLLIRGDYDYLSYTRPKPWDHLPGLLMLTESGGVTVELETGRPYGADTSIETTIIAAATPRLADEVSALWRAELQP